MEQRKIPGVIGGVGPAATVEFLKRVMELTPARCDQEHLHLLVDHCPSIPDRTAAILGQGESPVPALVASARRLEKMGADFIVIPCNTATYFLPPVRQKISLPIYTPVSALVKILKGQTAGLKRLALLATTGTVAAGIYQRKLAGTGLKLVLPDRNQQEEVMQAIYAVKAGRELRSVRKILLKVVAEMKQRK
ncbi:MAG TPA: amino acid racemase, partial [bacterium]|nr:amino acid racemase [bacterium]